MTKRTRLGVVTTGHGPRDEYIHFHEQFLRALGADVEVAIRHIYEEMSLEEITPYQVGKEKPNLGAHVHVPGAVGNHMGDGWEHRFYDLGFAVGKVQEAIDQLEQVQGADMVLLACAAEFPQGSLSAATMLIHPRELMFDIAGSLAKGSRRKIKIGVLVDAEHADEDYKDWARKAFFDKIELVMSPISTSWIDAARKLSEQRVDYAFFFGYGVGLAPHGIRSEIPALEAAIGAPLILPHRAAVLFLRNILRPALNDYNYLPSGWGKP